MANQEDDQSYVGKVTHFYFAPVMRAIFSTLYLTFFLYFILFYAKNVFLAVAFLFYTVITSTPLLNLSYLFWGAAFVISLLIPFTLSVYAIFLPYEISIQPEWHKVRKGLLIALVLFTTLDAIIITDYAIRYVAKQTPIVPFAETHKLTVLNQQE